jgi:hypothetical protein
MVRCCHAAMRRGHRSATKRAARRACLEVVACQSGTGRDHRALLSQNGTERRTVQRSQSQPSPAPAWQRDQTGNFLQRAAACLGLLEPGRHALGDRLLSPLSLHKSSSNLAFAACSAVLLPAFHFISWGGNYRHSTAPSPRGQFSHAWRGASVLHDSEILQVCAGAVTGAFAEQMGGSGSRPCCLAASLVFCRPAMVELR